MVDKRNYIFFLINRLRYPYDISRQDVWGGNKKLIHAITVLNHAQVEDCIHQLKSIALESTLFHNEMIGQLKSKLIALKKEFTIWVKQIIKFVPNATSEDSALGYIDKQMHNNYIMNELVNAHGDCVTTAILAKYYFSKLLTGHSLVERLTTANIFSVSAYSRPIGGSFWNLQPSSDNRHCICAIYFTDNSIFIIDPFLAYKTEHAN